MTAQNGDQFKGSGSSLTRKYQTRLKYDSQGQRMSAEQNKMSGAQFKDLGSSLTRNFQTSLKID